MSALAGLAYALLAVDYLSRARKGGVAVPPPGFGRVPVEDNSLANLFFTPDSAVALSPTLQRGAARGKVEAVNGLGARIERIKRLIKQGAVDPAVRKLAGQILAARGVHGGWAVREKDWRGEATAIFNFVRRNMRYTHDHATVDTFVHPARTLFDRKPGVGAIGDCLPSGTLLLVEGFQLVPIEMVQPGMRIWGLDGWTRVENVWAKGVLPTRSLRLNNGSSFRATKDHHVYVKSCPVHGPLCKTLTTSWARCRHRDFTLARIAVEDVEPGMVLATPERIDFGEEAMDPDRAWIEGVYVADGWTGDVHKCEDGSEVRYDFRISGKDGHPKEAQKHAVVAACARLGIETGMHAHYVRVKDRAWAERLAATGMAKNANKHVLSIDLDEPAAREMLRGLLADASVRDLAFTTTSRELAIQVRLLWKMQGVSCGEAYIEAHGGLGKNPIWRLTPRLRRDGRGEKALRVVSIDEDPIDLPCWDITTESGFVYLPAADVTVSNCDDYAIVLGSLLAAVGHTVKLRVVAARNPGAGDDPGWNHIYLLDELPTGGAIAGGPGGNVMALDASVDKPAGWEVPRDRIAKFKDFEV